MEFSISRLEGGKGWKTGKMGCKSIVNNAFNDFRDKVKIRDRTIARKVIRGKVVLFEKGGDKSMFELLREVTFG